jgi:hypothetical protein
MGSECPDPAPRAPVPGDGDGLQAKRRDVTGGPGTTTNHFVVRDDSAFHRGGEVAADYDAAAADMVDDAVAAASMPAGPLPGDSFASHSPCRKARLCLSFEHPSPSTHRQLMSESEMRERRSLRAALKPDEPVWRETRQRV